MRNLYIYIGAFVLFLFYTLFFTVKTGEEYILLPNKVVKAPNSTGSFSGGDNAMVGIEMANFAGFVGISAQDDNGLSIHFFPKKERVSVSSSALIFYGNKENRTEVILGSDLSKKSFQSKGWPMQLAGRFFFYDAAGSSLEERDILGNLLWERDLNSFITAFSATKERVLFGTVDGTCFLLDQSGHVIYRYTPDYHEFAVIAGAVLAQDGETFAVVSGIDPQKLEIFELVDNTKDKKIETKLLYSENLTDSSGRPIKMYFEKEESSLQLLLEMGGGLKEICPETCDSAQLSYYGDLSRFIYNPITGNKTFLSGTPDKGNISIYTAKERLLYQEFFNAEFRSIGELERYKFFSLDNNLLIVENIYE